MNSPFVTLRKSIAVPSLVLKYAHCVCIARSFEETLSLCLRLDEGDYPHVTGPMERIHDRLTSSDSMYFRDLQNTAKQYIRDHL
jgi:hypothetical protein